MEPFIGQIMLFAGNFAPRGWALCDGTLLSISEHSALFSILGTTYGGDGRTTFALPDLRGRAPIHQGSGPGLSEYKLGQKGGVESVTLPTQALTGAKKVESPDADAMQTTQGGKAHENRSPYLALNYIIALVGIYPSRS